MPFSTLELKDRAGIPNDVASIANKRLVTSAETNDGTRFNEARIKALTGCDPITARFLHHEFFTFQPVAKFWLSVNHKPRVADDSYGFWRRVRLIPFLRQFRDDADPNLERKLREELPGILAFFVRGCLHWQRWGLKPRIQLLRLLTTTGTIQIHSATSSWNAAGSVLIALWELPTFTRRTCHGRKRRDSGKRKS
jgi:P4 family phage/plasmid primase-like protien